MDETHLRRARSFGSVADAYRRARPGYPAAAVGWVLEAAPGRQVLDLAAGTGKLTQAIIDAGGEVVASVEPLDGMREQLAAVLPQVPALAGSAEAIPLGDSSADAVLVGQAFHWFDHERALHEIARVLRPGGMLGLFWNVRDDSVAWVRDLGEIAVGHDMLSEIDGSDWDGLDRHPRFADRERRDFTNPEPFDAERLVTWASSTSHFATMEPDERERTLAQMREFPGRHADLAGHERFDMPFVTVTIRARVRPA